MSVFDPENVKQSEGFVHPKHLFVSGGVAQEITNETTIQYPYTYRISPDVTFCLPHLKKQDHGLLFMFPCSVLVCVLCSSCNCLCTIHSKEKILMNEDLMEKMFLMG